jgi:hypothetical protein
MENVSPGRKFINAQKTLRSSKITDVENKYFKYLLKEKDFLKSIDQNLLIANTIKSINQNNFVNNFTAILTSFLERNINQFEYLDFYKTNHRIIKYLNKDSQAQIFIENRYIQSINQILSNINSLISNSSTSSDQEKDNALNKYYLSFIHFYIQMLFDKIHLEHKMKVLSFLLNFSFNFSKTSKLVGKSNMIIIKIIENLTNEYKQNFVKVMSQSYNSTNWPLHDIINYLEGTFYSGLLSIEDQTSLKICYKIVNMICNPIPISSDALISSKFEYSEPNTNEGMFGLCSQCQQPSEFYSVITRYSICSDQCKERHLYEYNLFDFLDLRQRIFYKNQSIDVNLLPLVNSINNLRKDFLTLLFDKTNELVNQDLSLTDQKLFLNQLFKNKFYSECFLRIFKCIEFVPFCTKDDVFLKVKKNLIKLIVKYIYFGDSTLLSVSFEIFMILLKFFGSVMRSDIKLLLEEITNILKKPKLIEIQKLLSVMKFLTTLFQFQEEELLLILFYNFDSQISEPDLIKNLLAALIELYSSSPKTTNETIKSYIGKILIKIMKILRFGEKFKNVPRINIESTVERIKANYNVCKTVFNENPKNLSLVITERNLNENKEKDPENVKFIAHFIRHYHGLDKEKIGEYIGKNTKFAQDLLFEFLQLFNFSQQNIADALRSFLFCFKICGEGQVIDRVMDKFSTKYYSDICQTEYGKFIANSDAAYYLSYNILLLHTSLYNPNVPKKDKMNFISFSKSLNKLNNNENFDETFLKVIYENIQRTHFFNQEFSNLMNSNSDTSERNHILYDSFSMNLDLLEKSPWLLYISPNNYLYIINSITKIVFNTLLLNLELILQNNHDKILITTFFEFFIYFLDLLHSLKLNSEKISVTNVWLKLVDFKHFTEIDDMKIQLYKFFYKIIKHKYGLFNEIWGTILVFFINKHIMVEKWANLNHSIIDSDTTNNYIKTTAKIFCKENIEILAKITIKLEPKKFSLFIKNFSNVLIKELEHTGFINKTQVQYFIMITSKYMQYSEELWEVLFKNWNFLIEFSLKNYSIEENNNLLMDFHIQLCEIFLTKVLYMDEYSPIILLNEANRIILESNVGKSNKIKILDFLKYKIKEKNFILKFIRSQNFILNFKNILNDKKNDIYIEAMRLFQSLIIESCSNNYQILTTEFLNILQFLFMENFEGFETFFLHIINSKQICEKKDMESIVISFFSILILNFYEKTENIELIVSRLLKIIKVFIQVHTEFHCDNINFFFYDIFKTCMTCYKHKKLISVAFIDLFLAEFILQLDNVHKKILKFNEELVILLIEFLSLWVDSIDSKYGFYNRIIGIIYTLCLDSKLPLFRINNILKEIETINLKIVEYDKRHIEQESFSFSSEIFNEDLCKYSFYLKLNKKRYNEFLELLKTYYLDSDNQDFEKSGEEEQNNNILQILEELILFLRTNFLLSIDGLFTKLLVGEKPSQTNGSVSNMYITFYNNVEVIILSFYFLLSKYLFYKTINYDFLIKEKTPQFDLKETLLLACSLFVKMHDTISLFSLQNSLIIEESFSVLLKFLKGFNGISEVLNDKQVYYSIIKCTISDNKNLRKEIINLLTI